MKIPTERELYNTANAYMIKSWQTWELGRTQKSWQLTAPARLYFLASCVTSLVLLPFAILRVTFYAGQALFTWNWKTESFQSTKLYILEKSNHFFLSFAGSFISPALAHKYRDFNLTPYIIALRVTVITGGVVYYAFIA